MKFLLLNPICLYLVLSVLFSKVEASTEKLTLAPPFDVSLSVGDLLDADGSSLFYGNLKLEYSPLLVLETKDQWLTKDRWVYQIEHNNSINQIELENRVQNKTEEISFLSTVFTLKYKAYRSLGVFGKETLSYGPSLIVDHVNFTKSDGTLYGVGGWLKFPVTAWFDGLFGISNETKKEKRIDFEASYYIDEMSSKLAVSSSYSYKASFIVFVSESFYTKLGAGFKSLELSEKEHNIDFGIKSPLVDVGVGYVF